MDNAEVVWTGEEQKQVDSSKILLIVGGEGEIPLNYVNEDVDVMAVNAAIATAKDAKYGVSAADFNRIDIKSFVFGRGNNGLNPVALYSPFYGDGVTKVDVETFGGSVFVAVMVGINLLGYKKVIVVCCPEDGVGDESREGWEIKADELKDTVRAVGGHLEEMFGEPTTDWIG